MRKEHIANLFKQLSFFLPKLENGNFHGEFLVNQIAVEKTKAEAASLGKPLLKPCPPDRDQLLDLIGKAGLEMRLFMTEFDTALESATVYSHAIEIMDKCLNAMLAHETEEMTTIEKMERVQGRYEQMAAFISDIANARDESVPMRIYKTAEYLNSKINAKKETVVEPIQKPGGTGGIDLSALPDPICIIHKPSESTGGENSMGPDSVHTSDAGGAPAENSDLL